MDSDQKSRGRKHHTNKKKYNKSKTIATASVKKTIIPAQSKSVTLLDSNWDRYEQQDEEKTINSSTDFTILANMPIGGGSHFQFKSDKDTFHNEPSKIKTSDLFNLDLNLLSHSIGNFPFYSRSGVDDKYFSNNQRMIMKERALDNKEKYNKYLESNGFLKQKNSILSEQEESGAESEIEDRDEVDTDDDQLNEITPSESEPSPLKESLKLDQVKEAQQPVQDLEEWLDDVLDD